MESSRDSSVALYQELSFVEWNKIMGKVYTVHHSYLLSSVDLIALI